MASIPASENVFPLVRMAEVAAPSTPAAGEAHLYVKSDGLLYWKDDAGTEYPAGAGGTPDLDDLGDVALAAPASGDVLTYDGSQWENAAPASSSADETIPAGGTLYDGTSTSGWTQFGTGGLTTFDADSTVPGALYLEKSPTGTTNSYGVYRAVGGAFPRTYTMKIKAADCYANYQGVGIMYGDSTPTAHRTWQLSHDVAAGGARCLQQQVWANTGSRTSNATTNAGNNPGMLPGIPLWLRVVVTSSTSVAYLASFDGHLYYTFTTGLNPAITVATFGIVLDTMASVNMRAAIDWIHES